MNINLTLLALVLSLILLILAIIELVLMYQKREFKLFMSAIVLMIIGTFANLEAANLNFIIALVLTVAIIIVKVIFYKRHKVDKFVRIVFYLQTALIAINFIMLIPTVVYLSSLGAV